MRVSIPVLLALTVGCATGAAVRDLVVPARAQGQVGPSYEYDVVLSRDTVAGRKKILAQYGQQGWRLVNAVYNNAIETELYFERQLPR